MADPRLIALLDEMVGDVAIPLESYPERLREIALNVPHTIVPLESAEPLTSYNCVMHALDMVGAGAEIGDLGAAAVSTAFVLHLIEQGILRQTEAAPGVLVTWRSDEKPLSHIGKLIGLDRALTKWGAGLLCEHGLDEVPSRYGKVASFYFRIDAENALEQLRTFHFGPARPAR